EAAQQYAKSSGQQGFSANQVMWSYPVFDMTKSAVSGLVWLDHDGRQYHKDQQLAVVAYQSQARGFFTKYAENGRATVPEALWNQYGSPENLLRYERVTLLAEDLHVSLNAVALAYVINQSFPSFAIVGSHTLAQLKDSMTAGDLILTPEQIDFLERG
ncbi:MAG: aldo/keto reductase, partial [Anaerolineae bacterium]|nr:aldo/keto reductase [Anaerolineae bacterium]